MSFFLPLQTPVNQLSNAFASELLRAQHDWEAFSADVALLRGGYVFSAAAPVDITDWTIARVGPMTGMIVADGWAKADPVYFPGVNEAIATIALAATGSATPFAHIAAGVGLPGRPPPGGFWINWTTDGVFRL